MRMVHKLCGLSLGALGYSPALLHVPMPCLLLGEEVNRLPRERAHRVFAPEEGLRAAGLANGRTLVAPPGVVATCKSFWSGERNPKLSAKKKTIKKHTSDKSLQSCHLQPR